jgi:hypothetical protein
LASLATLSKKLRPASDGSAQVVNLPSRVSRLIAGLYKEVRKWLEENVQVVNMFSLNLSLTLTLLARFTPAKPLDVLTFYAPIATQSLVRKWTRFQLELKLWIY